jgi:hypothetical protein
MKNIAQLRRVQLGSSRRVQRNSFLGADAEALGTKELADEHDLRALLHVVTKHAELLELLALKDEALEAKWKARLVVDLVLEGLDAVARLHVVFDAPVDLCRRDTLDEDAHGE